MKAKVALILFALVAVSVADVRPAPSAFAGYYELETDRKDANFVKYLETVVVSEPDRMMIQGAKKIQVRIAEPGADKQWKTEWKVDDKVIKLYFESGKEFETVLGNGKKAKTTITADTTAKTIKRVIKLPEPAGEATQEAKFTPAGFTLSMKCKDAAVELKWKRLTKVE